MTTHFGRFRMLVLLTMVGDELKMLSIKSLFKRSSMTFCMCVGSFDRKQDCIEHKFQHLICFFLVKVTEQSLEHGFGFPLWSEMSILFASFRKSNVKLAQPLRLKML